MVNEIFFVLYAKANFLCHLIVLKNWGNFMVCSACQLYQSLNVIENGDFFRAYDLQVQKRSK